MLKIRKLQWVKVYRVWRKSYAMVINAEVY